VAWRSDNKSASNIWIDTNSRDEILDPAAPMARRSRMGGAFLASLRSHQVIAVDTQRIRVVTRAAARLSMYRPEEGAMLAWELRAAE
jgi:hypothetical protein